MRHMNDAALSGCERDIERNHARTLSCIVKALNQSERTSRVGPDGQHPPEQQALFRQDRREDWLEPWLLRGTVIGEPILIRIGENSIVAFQSVDQRTGPVRLRE